MKLRGARQVNSEFPLNGPQTKIRKKYFHISIHIHTNIMESYNSANIEMT